MPDAMKSKRPLLMLWTVPPPVRECYECGRAIEALTQNAMVAIGTNRTSRVGPAMSVPRGRPEMVRKARFGSV